MAPYSSFRVSALDFGDSMVSALKWRSGESIDFGVLDFGDDIVVESEMLDSGGEMGRRNRKKQELGEEGVLVFAILGLSEEDVHDNDKYVHSALREKPTGSLYERRKFTIT